MIVSWTHVCLAEVKIPKLTHLVMPNLAPERFFESKALDLANAIDSGDAVEIRRRANGLDLNAVHKDRMTFLFYAINTKRLAAITELVKAGANPQQVDKQLGSPLDLAVRLEDSQVLKAMLDGGVSPDARNSWGNPLLFSAACLDSMDSLRLLVERKANLNAKDQGLGRTAASEALSAHCYDHVEFLIEHGADVKVTLVNGVTLSYSLQRQLERQHVGTPAFKKLTKIKRLMQDRGVKFPADPPPVVRAQMKAKGLKVTE
jgi:hypothetical protein